MIAPELLTNRFSYGCGAAASRYIRHRREDLRAFRHAPGHADAIEFLSMMGLRLSMPWLSIHLGQLVTLLS